MSFHTWHNRRHDVLRTTKFRKKDFDACAGGLCRFDENKFIFVGQDHRVVERRHSASRTATCRREWFSASCRKQTGSPGRIRPNGGLAAGAPHTRAIGSGTIDSAACADDFFSEMLLVRPHSEEGRQFDSERTEQL